MLFVLFQPETCYVDDVCATEGEINPINQCEICHTQQHTNFWSVKGNNS